MNAVTYPPAVGIDRFGLLVHKHLCRLAKTNYILQSKQFKLHKSNLSFGSIKNCQGPFNNVSRVSKQRPID